MARKFIVTIVALIAIVGLVVSGCGGPIEPEPPEPRTTGAFLDEVVLTREPSTAAAVQQLKNDAMDLFAYGISDSVLYQEILASPDLTSVECFGVFNELTFNVVGPTFADTGKLNPFSVQEFREAMHWLIDREYICGQIMGGLGTPRYTTLNGNFPDAKERFPDLVAAMEAEYAPDAARAAAVIETVMLDLGATKVDGLWTYGGEAVDLIGLIRIEDERQEIGDYFATLLEEQGFTTTRQYGSSRDLSPFWTGAPERGVFHFYTGGWLNTVIPRDEGDNFGFFYTKLGAPYMGPLWAAYENHPDFYEASELLWNYDYASLEERADLFEICIPYSMEENQRMFLLTRKSFTPMRNDVRVANDLAGGVYGCQTWAQTIHFADEAGDPIVGGSMRMATTDLLVNPWNPIAGSNWVYDMIPIRATGDDGTLPDPRTGLRWTSRIEKADVIIETGLPVGVTNTEWCTLTFEDSIEVPADAWADFNAATQQFIPVGSGVTAKRKSVSYYPSDIFELPLHDGSTLSMGDFILGTILEFDRAKEESDIYDEGYVATYNAMMAVFKGVKFITDDPNYGLIVEYYSDAKQMDAELNVGDMFPYYAQGPGMWHTIALGIRAEADNELAFSEVKSTSLEVEWMSFVAGPSLPILKDKLDGAQLANYIPYKATMGLYVTAEEAAERYTNLQAFYAAQKHFWVNSGPYYLERAYTTEKVVHLKRFEDFPDLMDKWLFVLDPL